MTCKLWSIAWAAAAIVCGLGQAGAETLIYVAPNGNDAWSGRLDAPSADGQDGPVATLEAAQKHARAAAKAGPVHVQMRGGEYMRETPFVLTPEDSGTVDAPVIYEAYPGETPLIHGGRRITNWRVEGNRWIADLEAVRDGSWSFGALWIDGERRTPARTPNAHHPAGDEPREDELFYMDRPYVEKDNNGKDVCSSTRFHYREGDLEPWPGLEDAVFIVYHSWATGLLRPKAIDTENRVIRFTGSARWHFGRWRRDQWYFVEHLLEALDQPGEWCLDRKKGQLHYMPMPGETPSSVDAVAPVPQQLVLFEGAPADNRFVEHVTLRGLHFAYTDYPIAPEGHNDGQAAFTVPAAIEAAGARHCAVEDCRVAHVGTYGVWFRAGCQHCRLTRCELTDLGAGGARIGEGKDPSCPGETCSHNTIENCFLHDGGRIFRSAVGVWMGRTSHNRLAHCEICDFRYTGISVGWSWGFQPSSANHNVIEYNHVHHVGHGQLSDMGAIYTLGVSPGTVIRNNCFHDVLSNPKVSGGWGIYFDEGSSDILAENNLVYNCLTGTLHQHYGRENMVRNNIFAFSHRAQLIRSREEDHISFKFHGNIVYFNNGLLLGSRWENGNWTMDGNVFWDTSGQPLDFAGRDLEEWRALGYDRDSIVADPLFVNAEAADFRFKPDSPAVAHGFKPFDYEAAGLEGDSAWTQRPKAIRREPFEPPPAPEPATFADGLEDTPVGDRIKGAQTLGEQGAAEIRVTDATAASGKHSLCFADMQGLDRRFNPHLVFTPHLRTGTAVGRFALRVEPQCEFFVEWRDRHIPYRIGPNLHFGPGGAVGSRGRVLAHIPTDTWVRFEIVCPLGKEAGAFDLTIDAPGKAPQRFEDLPLGSEEFDRLDWLGFVSNADAATKVWLDDVALELR